MSELFFSSSRGFTPVWMFTGKRNPITINYIIIYAVILLTCVTNLWLFLCAAKIDIKLKLKTHQGRDLSFMSLRNDIGPFLFDPSFFLAMIDCLNSIMCSHVYFIHFMSMDGFFLMHKKFSTLNFSLLKSGCFFLTSIKSKRAF